MLNRLLRLLKHRWHEPSVRTVSAGLLERVRLAVQASEAQHAGQLRVCIEAGLPSMTLLGTASLASLVRARAVEQFSQLHMWDTEHNSGVLIYLLLAERRIEIVADRGLSHHVKEDVWLQVVSRLAQDLRQGEFERGLLQAVAEVNALLCRYFPRSGTATHSNELPDAPVLQ